MKEKIISYIAVLMLGIFFGYGLCTAKVETQIISKEVKIETQPEVTYLNSHKYIIVPITESNKDTLVRPRDYEYIFKDTISEGNTTIHFEASGWGDLSNIKFNTEFSALKPKPKNNLYLGASYTLTPTNPLIGINLDYTIRDKILIGTSLQLHNNNYYPGVRLSFKL